MWSFASERALRVSAIVSIGLLLVATAIFYDIQNNLHVVGGEIAVVKLLWLSGAILLWGILPVLLLADARIGIQIRHAFALLAGLMLARAVVEGWMLYVTFNWSPWYGIVHDALCLIALVAFAMRVSPRNSLERVTRVHLWTTATFFIPEMYFAWYMQAHFTTQGHSAIYFVPDDPAYADVLRVTTVAVVCLVLYLTIFLARWIPVPKSGEI